MEDPGQPLRRGCRQQLQRRPAPRRRQAAGEILRAGILLVGPRTGAGREHATCTSHDPPTGQGRRAG